MDQLLEIKGIKKRFPTSKGFTEAVKGIHLSIYAGEVFGFLGPNGAGKTTTLRMLATLLPIDEGDALIEGHSLVKAPNEVRKRIGFVSQQGGSSDNETGYENLMFQGKLYGLSTAQTKKEIARLVEIFSLQECIDRSVKTFSGGQKRRLDLALGMIHKPKLLFLDEPTAGLDIQNRMALWEQIRLLKKEKVTIFITSHYLEEIDFLADRVAIIDHGKIVTSGALSALKAELGESLIHLEVPSQSLEEAHRLLEEAPFVKGIYKVEQSLKMDSVAGKGDTLKVIKLMETHNIAIESIQCTTPSLDDLFLKKTGHALRES